MGVPGAFGERLLVEMQENIPRCNVHNGQILLPFRVCCRPLKYREIRATEPSQSATI